jgi:hypothetical protein
MRVNGKLFIIVALVSIFGLLCYVDYLHDYGEKFEIEQFSDVRLFKIKGRTSTGCAVLSDTFRLSDIRSEDTFFVGFRFKLKYLSLKHEHLWEGPGALNGSSGHVDTMSSFSIINHVGNQVTNTPKIDSSKNLAFSFDKIDTWQAHHLNSQGCLEMRKLTNFNSFIDYYNSHSNKGGIVLWLNDYHLFNVDSTFVALAFRQPLKLKIKFSNGKIIEKGVELIRN